MIFSGGTKMQQIVEFSKTLGEMPVAALGALVVLGGFALSAFAIYAVSKIARGRRGGN
jgi:hypothetical protein